MPLDVDHFELVLKMNEWIFFALAGTGFPAHNHCELKVWMSTAPHDDAHRWQCEVTSSSTETLLVCRIKVPRNDSGLRESQTLDITVMNRDDPSENDTLTVPVVILG